MELTLFRKPVHARPLRAVNGRVHAETGHGDLAPAQLGDGVRQRADRDSRHTIPTQEAGHLNDGSRGQIGDVPLVGQVDGRPGGMTGTGDVLDHLGSPFTDDMA